MLQNQFEYYYKNIMFYHMACQMPMTNLMEIPKLEKVIINIGFPHISQDKKLILSSLFALEMLTHQKAFPTKTKKQVVTLKMSQNTLVGSALTLRHQNMMHFLNEVMFHVFQSKNAQMDLSYRMIPEDHAITFSLYNFSHLPMFQKKSNLWRHLPKLNFTLVFSSKESFWSFDHVMSFLLESFCLSMKSKMKAEDKITPM